MRLAIASAILLSLTSCGYSGWTRYPCQEFQNWKKPECNPPQCQANGICTEDLIGEDS